MKLRATLFIALGSSVLLLQGCVTSAVISGAAVATKVATDPRTIGRQVDDGTLEARLKISLSADPKLKKHAQVKVTVYQAKVLLTGRSPNIDMIRRARQIATRVSGVREVYNAIRRRNPIDPSRDFFDTWITIKVYSKLLTKDVTAFTNVKAVTENGEVFLLGLVTRQECEKVATLASQVAGVKHITTIFSYIK